VTQINRMIISAACLHGASQSPECLTRSQLSEIASWSHPRGDHNSSSRTYDGESKVAECRFGVDGCEAFGALASSAFKTVVGSADLPVRSKGV
jgi:hypothetical protein